MKDKLNEIMENIKKQNPNANWANLLTGVAVLVMVVVFSYAYFNKSKSGNVVIDDSKLVKQVVGDVEESARGADREVVKGEQELSTEDNTDQDLGNLTQEGDKGSQVVDGTMVVQRGEGLWHVAQRVCGDGEKYNILASVNGLNVWEDLNEGMTLKVVCK